MKGAAKDNKGASLLEVVVSIALLGLAFAPICSSLVLAQRFNDKSEQLLQARLQVTSLVEQLQAEGLDPNDAELSPWVSIVQQSGQGWYAIEVSDPDGLIVIETVVRAKEQMP